LIECQKQTLDCHGGRSISQWWANSHLAPDSVGSNWTFALMVLGRLILFPY
jgi:hypothetical protein